MSPTKQRLVLIGLIVIGVFIVGFFGLRTFHAFKKFNGHRPPHFPEQGAEPAETDVSLIRDWMTIGFLSHTYRMPPKLLYEALGIRPNDNEDKSLKQLNDEFFPDKPGYVLETVKTTIGANLPPPTAISPATVVAPPATSAPPAAP